MCDLAFVAGRAPGSRLTPGRLSRGGVAVRVDYFGAGHPVPVTQALLIALQPDPVAAGLVKHAPDGDQCSEEDHGVADYQTFNTLNGLVAVGYGFSDLIDLTYDNVFVGVRDVACLVVIHGPDDAVNGQSDFG